MDNEPTPQRTADAGDDTSAFVITDPAAAQRLSELADRIQVLSENAVASTDAMLAAWHAGFNATIDEIADALRHYAKQSRSTISENWSPADYVGRTPRRRPPSST